MDWKASLPITIQAPDYITQTLPDADPGQHVFHLVQKEKEREYEIKGDTTDYGRLLTDGKVDFGLVIPAISREQMLAFDVSSVISPRNDQISIIGNTVDIPSNIALPQQTESYILPISLNKPGYRTYVRNPGQYRLSITHGQFPLQRVVNDIRAGKSMFELINYFDFKQAGLKVVDVNDDLAGVDLAVNQHQFNSAVNVKAPTLENNQVMISLSLVEQNDRFFPTDLKRLTSDQAMNLKSLNDLGPTSVLSMIVENAQDAFIGATETFREFFGPLLWLGGGAPLPPPNQEQKEARLLATELRSCRE
ncbi:MAG: hypothetical protein HC902_07785 [Calothrix sp. SM1_5_4]|nr:hypothetical protein [Calothrix sp. SM1_5_4]